MSSLFDPERYRNVRKPLLEAEGLPPACYYDDAFYRREASEIFAKSWVMVGREERLPKRGDYFTVEFASHRLIVLRDLEGALRAHANTCRHRGSRLLAGSGNCRSIVCPYHAWTYALDGSLRGAAGMEETRDFRPSDYPLHSVRVDTWGGFIFVCVDPGAPGLAVWLGDLPGRLAMYGHADMATTRRIEYVVKCNWKIWVENFMEGYHIATVHRSTLSRQRAINLPEAQGGGQFASLFERHEGTRALLEGDSGFPPIATLEGDAKSGSRFIVVFPAAMLAVTNDTLWTFECHPLGPELTRVVLTSCFPRDRLERPDFETLVLNYYKRQDRVVKEDNEISEIQQEGLRSPLATPGRFAAKERIVHAIDNWVLDRVLG